MKEEAKAIEEVAKTAAKAIEGAEKIAGFLNKLFGATFIELAGIPHDWAKYFRYRNLLSIQDKVEAIHKKRSVEGKTVPIPPRYAIPLIQNASQEDDASIQDMWAGLIVNATDPNKNINPKKIYIELLSSLEPLDAKVLKFFTSSGTQQIDLKTLIERIGVNEKNLQLSLQNLARLGCIMAFRVEKRLVYSSPSSFGAYVIDPLATFKPSPLGFELIKTCETENQ